MVVYLVPKILGGVHAKTPVGGKGMEHLQDAVQLENWKTESIGPDLKLTADVKPRREVGVYWDY